MPNQTVQVNEPHGAVVWIFDPEAGRIYDSMRPRSHFYPQFCGPDEFISSSERRTLKELIELDRISPQSGAYSLPEAMDKYRDRMRSEYCKGPQPLTEETWYDLMNVMPPERWDINEENDTETFMVAECIAADLFTFCVRKGNCYWSLVESIDTPSEVLLAMCK